MARANQPSPNDAPIRAIRRRIARPMVLVGLMGVGKSTVGAEASNNAGTATSSMPTMLSRTRRSFSDPGNLRQFGEPYFRDGERHVIARLIKGRSGASSRPAAAPSSIDEIRALILDRG